MNSLEDRVVSAIHRATVVQAVAQAQRFDPQLDGIDVSALSGSVGTLMAEIIDDLQMICNAPRELDWEWETHIGGVKPAPAANEPSGEN